MRAASGSALPTVAIVVVSWNRRDDTLACLRSLGDGDRPAERIVVVDNASDDGSPDAIADAFPTVELIRNTANEGFAGGVDAGIRHALDGGADAVLLLNNDMVVDPDFLGPLVEALTSDPSAAAACSQILFFDPPDRIWYAGARYRPARGYHGRHTGYGRPPLPRSAPAYVTDRACGAAMLIPRAALERIGLFDEALFAYAEDVDWSLRARAAGLHVLVVPASVVRHHVSAASGGESSPNTLYLGLRNSLVVAERWSPLGPLRTWVRRAEALAVHVLQALLSGRRAQGLVAVRDGWRDFRAGRLGPRSP